MTKRKYSEAIEELEGLLAEVKIAYNEDKKTVILSNKDEVDWQNYFNGIHTAILKLHIGNTESPVTTLELARGYAEPERLITERIPLLLKEVYETNPMFHAIVTKHERIGSSYLAALEETKLNCAMQKLSTSIPN